MMTALAMEDDYIENFLSKLWQDYSLKDYEITGKKDSWLWEAPKVVNKGFYEGINWHKSL